MQFHSSPTEFEKTNLKNSLHEEWPKIAKTLLKKKHMIGRLVLLGIIITKAVYL